uniref:Notch homolog 2 n=1 Tax=Nothobranchius pienaari TaxID=704102 RepID=A0A1A8MEX5_9TELE
MNDDDCAPSAGSSEPRCRNGGQCIDGVGGYTCSCPAGFVGEHCEGDLNECLSGPCNSLGSLDCIELDNNYRCHCRLGFTGRHCESMVDLLSCWDLFKNGRCDKECDNPSCLFDGFECRDSQISPCKYDKYCKDHFHNGICDRSCYTEACGWDGLDCSPNDPSSLAGGTLIIVVRLQPEELLGDLNGFLRFLGALLHTNVQVMLNSNKEPMVFPYYGVEDEQRYQGRRSRSKREMNREAIGSEVHLEIDNRECLKASSHCFPNTSVAASFIAAEHIKAEMPYPLMSVATGVTEKPCVICPYLIGVAVVIVLLILVVGMLAAKKKHKHAFLWLPDGFLPQKNDKRREPVGQDDFDMKNFKSQDGSLVDGGQSQGWHEDETPFKKPRTEDKPLLSIPLDGGVDLREWTLQHRKAADITLTPPQADLDADCLDVNVKGPDGFTPLMLASLRNGGGPDCSLPEEEEESGDEPGPSVISDLITQGANLMAQTDRTGETALHLAARYARADAAKRLLDAGADPNAHDNMGRTPLHAAVAADAQGVFQILIRNRATELDARMNDGTTPLILAARLAVEGMVEELIHCHADINAVDDHGKSALHWAAAVNNVEATLVLLKNGANRDMQNNKEETPLFLAAREGSFEGAQVLLDHYSNRDITDHLDRLPRDIAQERMHHDIVRLLDQYNLVHSPHNGPNHMGGGGNSSVMCGANGAGFIANSPPLLSSPTSRMLPPVSHMLGQQQGWVGVPKRSYNGHMYSIPTQMRGLHPGMTQHLSQSSMLTSMNVTMSREQLPPIVTFQMMTPGAGRAMLKPTQAGQVQVTQAQGQSQALGHSQQGPGNLHCNQNMIYQMSDQLSMAHGPSHTLQGPHTISHVSHGGMEGQSRPLQPYPPMQSPVDKYPTPPSQHSYTTGSEGTPAHSAQPQSEHPYLTPSPESPDPWSSSSPHSTSDWSDVTTSPTPLGNTHHALPSSQRTHIPEQAQMQPQSQQMQQPTQQPQLGNMQVFA